MPKKTEQFNDYMHRIFVNSFVDTQHTEMTKDITFQVTEDCNMKCTYCYQENKSCNKMTFDVAKRFIDMILEEPEKCNGYIDSSKSVGVVIDFIGGEPFLEVELMDQIVDYFRERCFILNHHWANRLMISISSNGLLYFTKKVQDFIKKNKEILSLSISIDGNKELHDACRIDTGGCGTYDRAKAAVDHYINVLNGKMGTKMTLAPGNVQYTFEAIKTMLETEYDDIFANCVFEEGWEPIHATILYNQLKLLADYLIENDIDTFISIFDTDLGHKLPEEDNRNWCGGTGLMISVDWKGDIYPCVRYMDSSLNGKQPSYNIGNIYDGISKTESQCARCKEMECITRRSQSTDECFNCPIASKCAWCSAYNYQVFGTPNKRATYICIMQKAIVLANVYYWNKYYEKNNIDLKFAMNIPKDWALEIISEEEFQMLEKLVKERGDVDESNRAFSNYRTES